MAHEKTIKDGLVQKQQILGNSGDTEGGHRWTVGGIEVERGRFA